VGANPETLTIVDVNGNSNSAPVVITVVDNILPTVLTRAVTLYLDAAGQAAVTAQDVDNLSFDNCGIASLTLSQTSFVCSEVGANPETLTIVDVNGNTNSAPVVITVDNILPTVLTRAVILYLDADGQAAVTADDVNNGSYDNCGIASMSLAPNTFDCSNMGLNTVTLTVTDVHDNTASATAIVTITNPITLTYTGTTIQATGANNTANVEFVAVVDSLDGCGITPDCITFTTNPAIGTEPIVGQHIFNIPGTTKYRISVIAPVSIGTAQFVIYNVVAVAGCYFTGSSETAYLTVYKPNGDMVTGGGYIIPGDYQSAGTYPATSGTKANFGFNVKNKPTGIQGELNYKFECENREFQVKATSFSSLGVVVYEDDDYKIAEFTAIATLSSPKKGADPAINTTGLTLRVTLTDNGEPGNNDKIGFTVWNGDILVHSSWWFGYYTKELPIGGGNLVVHKGLLQAEEVEEGDIPEDILSASPLSVFPNPTNDQTTFRFVPGDDCKAKLEIYTLTGTLVETLLDANVATGQLYEIKYRPALRNSTMLLYRLILGDNVTAGKLIFQK